MDMSDFGIKDINPFGSKNIAAEHRKLTDEEQLSISNVVYEKVMSELKNNINQTFPQIIQSITDEVTQKFQEEINRLKQRINDLKSRNANLSAQSVSIVSKNKKTVLSEDEMDDIDFYGFHFNGWIYYKNERQGNFLYKVREDGTENIQLTDYSIYSNHFTVKDGYLYFNTDAFNTSKIKL